VRQWLGDPEIALLVLVWRPFLLVERHGPAAVARILHEHLLAALRGAYGVEIPLGRLLLVLLGLTFVPLSTIGRHLLAPMARKSIPCQRGFQPFLWLCRRLVQEVASIVEKVALARLRHERPAEVAAYVRAFVAIARAGGEPFRELVQDEPLMGQPIARRATGLVRALVAALARSKGGEALSGRLWRGCRPWRSAVPPWLGPPSAAPQDPRA